MKRLVRSTVAVALLLIASMALRSSRAWSQAAPPANNQGTVGQTSPAMAYHFFFGHVVFLDEKALRVERSGTSGVALRNHYKSRLQLLDKDEAAMLRRAKACEKEVADHDEKATQVIEGLWTRIPTGKTPADFPVPPEIFQLQAEREAILEKHLSGLKSDLTAESFGRLDVFVRGEFLRRSSVRLLTDVPQRFSVSGAAARARSADRAVNAVK